MRAWFQRWLARRLPPQRQVQLQQKTIFILPTPTGITMLGVMLLMLLFAINYQNNLAYGLTFLLFSVSLLAALHTWRNLNQLILQSNPAADVFAGDSAYFNVHLSSPRRFYQSINLSWYEQTDNQQRYDVRPEAITPVTILLVQAQRGLHKTGRVKVQTVFPLGIWRAWSLVDLAQQVLVYPKPIEGAIATQALAGDEQGNVSASDQRGTDDYDGLRDWQQGESMQRINWKVWSKTDRFVVNHFTSQQAAEHLLAYTAVAGDMEYRLSVLCFHVLRLSQSSQIFTLQLPNQTIGPDQGELHKVACLQALAHYGEANG